MSGGATHGKQGADKTVPAGAPEGVRLSPEERRRQRARNVAIGLALGGLFVLFYILTIARLGSNVFNRPL
ncbi:hypothetical protein FHS82_000288 [Pseudochelatococcus lubricantis]|uniref:Uncharacterized protein n=1 Tax=Pseudochelatococcus lubricantis TaxID=1538102 RepID=A0ABX0UX90_9HYPH|nr:hypothetical protein [Pseudochelatococcus lubricantis]NIJ56475.1 hypothetical protein [Pseudochelatococcus lubricantis]